MPSKKEHVILLHGRWPEKIDGVRIADIPLCDSNNELNWMGWTKKKLEEKGHVVACPMVLDAWKAPYEEWKRQLDTQTIDENTILVGLSAGAYALMRYLGESSKTVKKLILLAPASKRLLQDRDAQTLLPFETEFYGFEITEKLRSQIKAGTTILVSTDDYAAILESVQFYKKILNANVIELKHLGHLSFLIKELPELLEEILKA